MRRAFAPLLALLLVTACAARPTAPCAEGQQAGVLDTLYFGTARPQGVVTPADWQHFVQEQIAPRLPQGYTVLDAQGQWRNTDGSVAHEASHVLQWVHADDAASDEALRQIADRYKSQFQQEAVLHLHSAACYSF